MGRQSQSALEGGAAIADIMKSKTKDDLAKVKYEPEFDKALGVILKSMDEEFAKLRGK